MKIKLLLSVLVLGALSATAQEASDQYSKNGKAQVVKSSAQLIPDQNEKGKWGYVNPSGDLVVKYNYDSASGLINGFARVSKGEKIGYIDASGKEVLKPEYDEITTFTNGLARVQKGKAYGFINADMQFVIPCKFSAVGSVNDNGLVWVADGKKYGIYRNDGTAIIEPKYKTIGYYTHFEYTYPEENIKDYGYTQKSHYKHDPSYRFPKPYVLEPKPFSKLPVDALGYFYSSSNGFEKNAVVDPNGKELIKAGKYARAYYPFEEGLAPVYTKVRNFGQNDVNFLNINTGTLLLKDDPSSLWAFHDGVAMVKYCYDKKGKPTKDASPYTGEWFFIDTDGNKINTTPYTEIFARNSDVYVVRVAKLNTSDNTWESTYGMADKNGHEVLAPTYHSIMAGADGLFGASVDNDKYGYLNNKGQWVIEPKYDFVNVGQFGLLPVTNNELWGYVNRQGVEVVPTNWEGMRFPTAENAQYVWMKSNNGTFEAISTQTGSPAFKGGYLGVFNFDQHYPGVALVQNGDNKFGCINDKGEVVIPLKFANFDIVRAVYNEMQRNSCAFKQSIGHRVKLQLNSLNQSYRLKQTLDNNNWEY